jgi:murein DD-endopeptidase MepM/ murein hydrolase activator NlpD
MLIRALVLVAMFFVVLGAGGRTVIAAHSLDDQSAKPAAISVDKAFPSLQLAKKGERKKRKSGRRKRKSDNNSTDNESKTLPPCTACEDLEGYVPSSEIADDVRIMVGKARSVDKTKAVEIQKARGAIETGLEPDFIDGASCPEIDSEKWAIDYSNKRPWPALHKGIDIPQPEGTPILAVAAGTVVGRFLNEGNRKGIEIMLRHTPEQTGLEYWTYSQYTHLLDMSPLAIGAGVEMGEEVGKTSNTGKMGRRIRRDALHFAIIYSTQPGWSHEGRFVVPKDGYWMDPNAFYRLNGPYDSQSLAQLPDDQKAIQVPYVKIDGGYVPVGTKRIWPYPCE